MRRWLGCFVAVAASRCSAVRCCVLLRLGCIVTSAARRCSAGARHCAAAARLHCRRCRWAVRGCVLRRLGCIVNAAARRFSAAANNNRAKNWAAPAGLPRRHPAAALQRQGTVWQLRVASSPSPARGLYAGLRSAGSMNVGTRVCVWSPCLANRVFVILSMNF